MMIRTSNKLNSGSRKNKKHKFVPSRAADVGPMSFDLGMKPDHKARATDISDCYPLAKLGHTFFKLSQL